MHIPFYKQETEWTCGAAAVRMVFASSGIKKSEAQLVKLLRTTHGIHGTMHADIARVAEKYLLNYVVRRNASINDLKALLKQNYRIIVGFFCVEENVPHYAVVKKVSASKMHLLDPWFGPDKTYTFKQFQKIWYDGEGERGWCIGIKK